MFFYYLITTFKNKNMIITSILLTISILIASVLLVAIFPISIYLLINKEEKKKLKTHKN